MLPAETHKTEKQKMVVVPFVSLAHAYQHERNVVATEQQHSLSSA
jgi:hypothetical protein